MGGLLDRDRVGRLWFEEEEGREGGRVGRLWFEEEGGREGERVRGREGEREGWRDGFSQKTDLVRRRSRGPRGKAKRGGRRKRGGCRRRSRREGLVGLGGRRGRRHSWKMVVGSSLVSWDTVAIVVV